MSDISTLDEQSEKVNADSVNKKLDLNNNSNNNNPLGQHDTLIDVQKIIPIKEERFSITKETVAEVVKIQKRRVTKTKKIEVPILSEEIFVNGRRLRYYDKLPGSEILSKVKDSLKEGLDIATNNKKEQGYSTLEAHESKREIIPLFESVNEGTDANNNKEIEKVIPILGEEIVITKRKVKVGELVVKKNRVTVHNKIEIGIKKEEARVKHPDVTTSDT